MTEATVERIARLMHAEAARYLEERGRKAHPWEAMTTDKCEQYRFVARALLRKLGH